MPPESPAALPGPSPAVWNRLAEAAGNIFATHTWASCWWQVYGEGGTPYVVCDDERTPRVILPLYGTGRLLRQVRFLGHGPADLLGPVCAPGDLALAAPLLQRALDAGVVRGDVLLLQDMPVATGWWEPLGARQVSREPSPVLDLSSVATWEEYLATKSKNFRSQTGRKARGLARDHDVEHRLATAATLEADLADLFMLHEQRWEGETPLTEARHRRFVEAFCAAALEQGWLRLRTMHLDGRCAAAYLGFRFGPHEYYYQFGRDPGLGDASVGLVLLTHAVREAVESGAQEFRLLRGGEDYKSRFATGSADVATWVLPRTVRGRAAAAAAVRRRRTAPELTGDGGGSPQS